MMDLKHPERGGFHISDMPKSELKPGQKVRCGIYRVKPGCPKPQYKQHSSISIPKEIFDGHLQTGSTRPPSPVPPRVVEALGLKPSGKGHYMGIGGDQESDTFFVHIGLPNGQLKRYVNAYCADLDDYDILLGMDIITQTDFLITNADGKTTFQFRTPSEGGVEL